MVCGSLKLALLGSLSYSYWTIVLYLNREVSIKLERYPKKDWRRERGKEREGESSFDKKLNKSGKNGLCEC